MIQYKLKWAKVVAGAVLVEGTDEAFENLNDLHQAIKAMHIYTGEPYELKPIKKGSGITYLLNPKTATQFIITWVAGK